MPFNFYLLSMSTLRNLIIRNSNFPAIVHYIKLIKEAAIYSLGTILVRLLGLLVAPFAVAILKPSEYGLISLVTVFVNFVSVLLGAGLRQMMAVEFCRTSNTMSLINKIVATYILVSIPYFIFCIKFTHNIRTILSLNNYHALLTLCVFSTIYVTFFADITILVLQQKHKAYLVTAIQVLTACGATLIKILFLLWSPSATAQLVSNFMSVLPLAIIGMYLWTKNFFYKDLLENWVNHLKVSTNLLSRSLPNIPLLLFPLLIAMSDRFFLMKFSNLELVGLYSFADLFAQLLHFILQFVFQGAYLPHIIKRYELNQHRLSIIEHENLSFMKLCTKVIWALFFIGLIPAIPLSLWILPLSYRPAIPIIVFLCMSQLIQLNAYFGSTIIYYTHRQSVLPLFLLGSLIANICTHLVITAHFPFIGAALASLIAYSFYTFCVLKENNRLVMPLPLSSQ